MRELLHALVTREQNKYNVPADNSSLKLNGPPPCFFQAKSVGHVYTFSAKHSEQLGMQEMRETQ